MEYEASFSGILKILFWIFFVAFLIRLVANLALPRVIRKAEERMKENATRFRENQRPIRPEGDVTIESNSSKHSSGSDGDFVDYIEIKD